MATNQTRTFGTTVCTVHTRFHVTPLSDRYPAVATASVNGRELADEKTGMPVEKYGKTEDDAREAMIKHLEKLYGPMA